MPTRLNCERRRRGWSQQHVANLVGLHTPSTVSRWERRSRRPYRRHAVRLEAVFGMPLAALLEDESGTAPKGDAATLERPAKNARAPKSDAHR
jgi:transcriptional regulator with XRE-family HTH domain